MMYVYMQLCMLVWVDYSDKQATKNICMCVCMYVCRPNSRNGVYKRCSALTLTSAAVSTPNTSTMVSWANPLTNLINFLLSSGWLLSLKWQTWTDACMYACMLAILPTAIGMYVWHFVRMSVCIYTVALECIWLGLTWMVWKGKESERNTRKHTLPFARTVVTRPRTHKESPNQQYQYRIKKFDERSTCMWTKCSHLFSENWLPLSVKELRYFVTIVRLQLTAMLSNHSRRTAMKGDWNLSPRHYNIQPWHPMMKVVVAMISVGKLVW